MRGRPITNHSPLAKYKREHMRRVRAAAKAQAAAPINPNPLATALANWTKQ